MKLTRKLLAGPYLIWMIGFTIIPLALIFYYGLTDASGERIRAEGSKGETGGEGKPGKDGTTPQLKIENDYWYISYDNGDSWTQRISFC